MKGILVEWNHGRGFGFVEPAAGGARAFCHISQFPVRSRRPVVGDRVTYETSRDERGRLRALKIQPAHTPRAKEVRTPLRMSPWVAVLVSVIFLIAVGGLAVTGHLPWIAPVVYMAASAVTVISLRLRQERSDKGAVANSGVNAPFARFVGRLARRLDLATTVPAQDQDKLFHSGFCGQCVTQPCSLSLGSH
jgi:cold shock CspA family protein